MAEEEEEEEGVVRWEEEVEEILVWAEVAAGVLVAVVVEGDSKIVDKSCFDVIDFWHQQENLGRGVWSRIHRRFYICSTDLTLVQVYKHVMSTRWLNAAMSMYNHGPPDRAMH